MEVNKCYLSSWHNLPSFVRGNKAHKFTTASGQRIYLDFSGVPRNFSDDSLVTNIEGYLSEAWTWEHSYNIQETDMATAINAFRNGQDGLIFEVVINPQTNEKRRHVCWNTNDSGPIELRRSSRADLFTITELFAGKWFIAADTY